MAMKMESEEPRVSAAFNELVTGAEILVQGLVRAGVETVFTLCGNHVLPLYKACHDLGIELLDTRSEAGAVMAADAYSRVSRRIGVALVTGGPGHSNALTGLATAHAARSRVLLISGQTELSMEGRGALQELDQVAMAAPCTKWARQAKSAAQMFSLVNSALNSCLLGTAGATHLSVPLDVLTESVPAQANTNSIPERRPSPATAADVQSVADLLSTARRPAVIAGTGAYWSGSGTALERLVETWSIPIFTIDQARGIVPDSHPMSFGYADPSLSRVAGRLNEADLVLLLGKDLDFRLRFGAMFAGTARIVQIDDDPSRFGVNRTPDVAVIASIDEFANALSAHVPPEPPDFRDWTLSLKQTAEDEERRRTETLDQLSSLEGVSAPPFHPLAVAMSLRSVLESLGGTVVLDGGDFVQWCRSVLPAEGAGKWLRLGPMATCGAGTPYALGAKRAQLTDEPVFLITGDGSFGYYVAEVEAAARQRLPFVAIVGNNRAWALERNLQRGLYGEEYVLASSLSDVRYDLVVEGFGGYGERVNELNGLPGAIERALGSGKPACIDIPVSDVPSPFTQSIVDRGGEV